MLPQTRRRPLIDPARGEHAGATTVVDPRMDEAPAGFFHEAGDAVAAAIAHAERRTVEAQGHMADPTALAPILERFFRF